MNIIYNYTVQDYDINSNYYNRLLIRKHRQRTEVCKSYGEVYEHHLQLHSKRLRY